jgi:Tol biopolymer transport system component/predicted Ser/Thr protein kinase
MPLAAGTRLGPYEIVEPIGKGGMGEVYRARDTRLGRDVAVKVSAEKFSERFEREVRAIASLNHPNICQLYDVGDNYLVMELIDGPTLADRIRDGAIPLEESLHVARQITAALEAAHEKGIIHRDLKPGNIKITPQGVVKVLDFGLALVTVAPASAGESDPINSPTLTMRATQAGMILGTAAYMSPEQARGKPVDKRTDIWAFGVVFFEMLTGKPLFAQLNNQETVSDILAAVLRHEPDWEQVPPSTRRLLKRCLEKDPAKRLRDIGDAWGLLEDTPPSPARQGGGNQGGGKWVWPAAALALAVALALVSAIHFRETPPEVRPLRATILPPDNTTFDFSNGLGLPAVSPDGRRIVFGARSADGKIPLWIRPLDALTAQPLAGTEGASFPFWSPDSRFIAFFADDKLKKIDASGGPAITLADAPLARGGSWSPLGVILFARNSGTVAGPLQRISASGGTASPLPLAIGRLPWFLPDGRHFLYEDQRAREVSFSPNESAITIRVSSLDGGGPKTLLDADSNAVYAQGHLLFTREGTLMAQPFDTKRLETAGEAVPVAEGVQGVLNTRTAGVFSISDTGLLALHAGEGALVLTWFDRGGKRGATVGDAADLRYPTRVSPDQKSLATELRDRTGRHVWIYDLARGTRTRLTLDDSPSMGAVWSPDSRTIAFASFRNNHYQLYRKSANGVGSEELLYFDDFHKAPDSWFPYGKFLLYTKRTDRSGLWALPLTPDQHGGALKPFPVVDTLSVNFLPEFSPDGHWIAYTSNESGRFEVYATPFPPGAGGKRQISNAGGSLPKWRKDGKELFFSALDGRLMAAEIALKGGALEVGEIQALFLNPSSVNASFGPGRSYEVTADGQRFLIPVAANEKSAEPLTLIQNWAAGLRR